MFTYFSVSLVKMSFTFVAQFCSFGVPHEGTLFAKGFNIFKKRCIFGAVEELSSIASFRKGHTPHLTKSPGNTPLLSSLSTHLSSCMASAGLTILQVHQVTPQFLCHYFAQAAQANGASLEWISETFYHSYTKITKVNY
jgi:hypothetical protein